ncbi:MAG: FG-GAP-like repeat-containing protein, partial [Phycisphaerales bacterium]|nr:FG-GAP-like repeat-containing protein [Phycisphaerales bacterium]
VLARSATTPASGNDRFATVVLPGLPNDLAFQLTYGPPPGIAGGGPWEAAIEVVSLSGLLGFDDPSSLPVTGTPIAMEVVDLTGDGAEEICVAFAGVPGQLVIFENDGAGGITQQVVLNTGADPTSLASGDWDADGRNDLAVGHDGGDVYVLLNDDNDPSNGFALQTLTGEGPVTCLTRANINFDAPLDIIAGIADTDGDGSGRWQWWLGQTAFRGGGLGGGDSIDTPGNPVIIDPSENEDQKDYIAAGILGTGRAVILKNLLGAQGLSQSTWVVGADPRDIDLADLDGDGIRDIVATSAANGNIALLLGAADPGNFDNALFIPVGSEPSGIAAHDFDGDGNVDLAAVVVNDDGGRIVRVLQNEGGLSFTTVDTAQGESPVLLSLGDINGDGNDQLVTVGSATSLSGEETTVALRDVTQIDCPGDVDSNGVVNIEDLLAVISQFGNDCEGGESCWADCDDNGMINIEDLLVVIGGFGNCDG